MASRVLPTDFELASQHASRGHQRRIAVDGAQGTWAAWGEVHQEEGEGRRVRGEEAGARKGGFGDEERDGWRLGGAGRM